MYYNPEKNAYLQQFTDINHKVIEKSVEKAFRVPTINKNDIDPAYKRFSASNLRELESIVDVIHPNAFGRLAIPVLKTKLVESDTITVLIALKIAADLLHNPELLFQALNLNYIKLLGKLLASDNIAIQERTCVVLTIIASQRNGCREIIKNHTLLLVLLNLLEHNIAEMRCKAAALVEMISRDHEGVCDLIYHAFVTVIIDGTFKDRDEITLIHLDTLERVLSEINAQEIAFKNDILKKLVKLLKRKKAEITIRILRCLAVLMVNIYAKEEAVDMHLLLEMSYYTFFPNVEIHTNAVKVIMFITHTTKAKKQGIKMKSLQLRLLEFTKHYKNYAVQMYSLQALINLCQHPAIRKTFLTEHLAELENIPTENKERIIRFKSMLLEVVLWKPEIVAINFF